MPIPAEQMPTAVIGIEAQGHIIIIQVNMQAEAIVLHLHLFRQKKSKQVIVGKSIIGMIVVSFAYSLI